MKRYTVEVTVWEITDNVNIALADDAELIASYEFDTLEPAKELWDKMTKQAE